MPLCLHKTTWQLVPSLDVTRQADPSAWFVEPDLSRVAGCDDRRFWKLPPQGDAFNGPELMTAEEQLPIRKADKLRAIARWLATATDGGVSVGGLTLGGTAADRASFAAWVTLHTAALVTGQETAEAATFLIDKDGVKHEMTVAQVLGVLLQYGQACAAKSSEAAALRAAVDAAADRAALDAVSVPSC